MSKRVYVTHATGPAVTSCCITFYFLGPPLFLRRHLEAIPNLACLKCGRCCAQCSIYHQVLPNVLVKYFKIVRSALTSHIQRGTFKNISPSESKCCNFEIKYFRFEAFFDVVSTQTGNCTPGTPILLSQLKTNAKVGWSLKGEGCITY